MKKSGRLRQFIGLDWESLAGVIAAVTALVLHLLHLAPPDVLVVIAVLLLSLLFIRDIRRERQDERILEVLQQNAAIVSRIQSNLKPADADLVGPERIRASSEEFSREAQGEMIWFNVCLLMFKPEWLFNLLLRPAIENPAVTSILFILDPKQRPLWEEHLVPKIKALAQNSKVQQPHWVEIDEMVSIIQGHIRTSDKLECLLSFWGEPFMSHTVDRDVPRYVFWVRGHSELVTHLSDLIRRYRLRSG